MRSVVQKIYIKCPKKMQVMMFSATISDDVRAVTRKFMKNVRLPTTGTSLRAPVTCASAQRGCYGARSRALHRAGAAQCVACT